MPVAQSIPTGPEPVPRARRSAGAAGDVRLAELGVDVLWIGFLVLATGAGNRLGLANGERIGWLALDALVVLALIQRPRFVAMVGRHWVLMSWAALACLSALWSLAPAISLYHGLQLAMTIVAGLMLAASAGLARIVRITFLALFLTALLSLAFNLLAPAASTGWQGAWMGAFSHKNTLGSMMALLVVTSLVLLLAGWRPALCTTGLALGALLLVLSRSGTAFLSVMLALAALLPFVVLRKRQHLVPFALGLLLAAAAVAAGAIAVLDLDPMALALDSVGKDTTLTGRSLLWEFGLEAFQKRPWLGHGFKGYWEGEATTVGLLRFAIGADLWFFHNNFIEVAVAFGVLGPLLLAVGIVWALARALAAAALSPGPLAVWPLALLLLVLPQCLAENPLFYNHSILQFLFAAAAAVAGEEARRSRTRRS